MREPVYYLLKQHLLDVLETAQVGERLPSERALAEQFATSRASVRQAVHELVVEGRLAHTQGSGTYVAPPKLALPLDLTSFTAEARAAGFEPGTTLLETTTQPAGVRVAAGLQVTPSTRVIVLVRLRTANGLPMAIERTHVVSSRFPGLRRRLDSEASLYRVLREEYRVEPSSSEDTLETGVLSATDAELLETVVGLPALHQRRLAYDADGVAFEWTESVYRGDRFALVARLQRR